MLYEHTKCKKCNHINPAYKNICSECKNYLRERVVNIDLWNTIQLIIEDPLKAFKQIIFAEHKNFIFFITFLIAIKNLLVARFLSVPKLGINGVTTSFIISLALMVLITLSLSLSFTFIQKTLYNRKDITLRFRDIYAVNAFSFIPYLFGLFFVFPVELIVLGGDIFSNNPYSFDIKPVVAYILIVIEFIIILWSFYLISNSIFSISANRLYSILITLAYVFVWGAALYISSNIIFNI
jgi:hypothetical protein